MHLLNSIRPGTWLALILVFAVGIVGGLLVQYAPLPPSAKHAHPAEESVAVYVCPMHPEVTSASPGTCPICGMALVPKSASALEPIGAPVVHITPEMVQNLGVRTAKVRRTTLSTHIEIPGIVQEIQPHASNPVDTHVSGQVARLVAHPGAAVEVQEVILELESPELLAAQQEYLAFIDQMEHAAPEHAVARLKVMSRLKALGMTDEDIQTLTTSRRLSSRVTIRAPQAGRLERFAVKAGETVKAGAVVAEVGRPSSALVFVNAFPRDALWFKPGVPAQMMLQGQRHRAWPGKVISSIVANTGGSTVRNLVVTMRFDVADNTVANGLYVLARISGATRAGVLTLPRDAVIRTEQGARVVRALGNGHFQPVPVELGIESGDQVEIVSGLHAGEEVATSTQFLIDSESSLLASLRRLESPHAEPHL